MTNHTSNPLYIYYRSHNLNISLSTTDSECQFVEKSFYLNKNVFGFSIPQYIITDINMNKDMDRLLVVYSHFEDKTKSLVLLFGINRDKFRGISFPLIGSVMNLDLSNSGINFEYSASVFGYSLQNEENILFISWKNGLITSHRIKRNDEK